MEQAPSLERRKCHCGYVDEHCLPSSFLVTNLSATDATVLDGNGKSVGSGTVTLASSSSLPVAISGALDFTLNGEGSLSFYASSERGDDLGVSGLWQNYSAALSGQVIIRVASDLTLNGTTLPTGTYTIEASSSTLFRKARCPRPTSPEPFPSLPQAARSTPGPEAALLPSPKAA